MVGSTDSTLQSVSESITGLTNEIQKVDPAGTASVVETFSRGWIS